MVEEDKEIETDPLVLGCESVYYSTQDVDELHQEWQEMHQQELIDIQQCMQVQMNVQLARSGGQGSLGGAEYPAAGVVLMGQSGLSMATPVFVPGQGPVGMGTTFYNSTPHASNQTQQMGSVSRSMDRTDLVNVYGSFQKQRQTLHAMYRDHRIADPWFERDWKKG